MIKEILCVLFVFNQYRYKKPVNDAVRICWICDQYFYSYPDNPHLVCPDCKDAIKEYGYKRHVLYFSKIKKKTLKKFNGINNQFFSD